MVFDGTASLRTSEFTSMMNKGCKMMAHEPSAHDQKYDLLRRFKSKNKDMFIPIPTYHGMPINAASNEDMGRFCVISPTL
jgi:hypothetical protein